MIQPYVLLQAADWVLSFAVLFSGFYCRGVFIREYKNNPLLQQMRHQFYGKKVWKLPVFAAFSCLLTLGLFAINMVFAGFAMDLVFLSFLIAIRKLPDTWHGMFPAPMSPWYPRTGPSRVDFSHNEAIARTGVFSSATPGGSWSRPDLENMRYQACLDSANTIVHQRLKALKEEVLSSNTEIKSKAIVKASRLLLEYYSIVDLKTMSVLRNASIEYWKDTILSAIDNGMHVVVPPTLQRMPCEVLIQRLHRINICVKEPA